MNLAFNKQAALSSLHNYSRNTKKYTGRLQILAIEAKIKTKQKTKISLIGMSKKCNFWNCNSTKLRQTEDFY